jgi:membrane fusion protein (multidrug efflux system)
VTVQIDALGDTGFPARIQRIYPDVDPSTRRGRVEIALSPVPPGARAGQLCRVTIRLPALEAISVPLGAVKRDNDGEYVFVLDQQKRAHRVAVRTGTHLGVRVAILEGLRAGEQVVTKGFLDLKDGMTVQPVGGSGKG